MTKVTGTIGRYRSRHREVQTPTGVFLTLIWVGEVKGNTHRSKSHGRSVDSGTSNSSEYGENMRFRCVEKNGESDDKMEIRNRERRKKRREGSQEERREGPGYREKGEL